MADAVAVLDAAGSKRPHILGHSLGGMIVQELALTHSERVASLTITNSWARSDTYVTSELARDLSQPIEDDALRPRAIYFIVLDRPALRAALLAGIVEQVLAAGPAQSTRGSRPPMEGGPRRRYPRQTRCDWGAHPCHLVEGR